MKLFKNHNHLTFVIAGSLILLGIMEGIWLKKLYHDEAENLKDQVEHAFKNNILTAQMTIMQKNNFRLVDSFMTLKKIKDSSIVMMQPKHIPRPIFFEKNDKNEDSDSIHKRVFLKDTFFELKKSGNLKIIIEDPSRRGKNQGFDSFKNSRTYDFIRFVESFVTPEDLKKTLDSTFRARNMDLSFEVKKLKANETFSPDTNALIVTTRNRGSMGEGDKIAVAIYGYQPYLLKRMLYEMLFALFVFGITTFSFWAIYRSFLDQKRLIELKNDFISNVTHELKTPITTVGVAIEALKNFDALKNPNLTKEYLDISKNELNRLSLLVDKVLKMAAFEQKDPPLNLEIFDLAEVVEQVMDSMKLQFEKYNAEVNYDKNDAHFTIEADKTHITSVIYNLFDNALKYGGESPTININLQAPIENFVKLSVSDTGAGIPPQYLGKIFEKFFRIPNGDIHNTKGHGLGLSYVSSIISQHSGKIEVKSEVNQGSTFTVFLPLKINS